MAACAASASRQEARPTPQALVPALQRPSGVIYPPVQIKTGQTYRLPREIPLIPQLKYEKLPALRETIPSLAYL
jgi:hypothetical protein